MEFDLWINSRSNTIAVENKSLYFYTTEIAELILDIRQQINRIIEFLPKSKTVRL